MGGCAMVAQTLVNLNAGSRARLSGIIASLTILVIILVGAPFIEKIPMAALVGVDDGRDQYLSVGFISIIIKMPKSDIFVGITVALITIILHNLALAVLVGVIISALVFCMGQKVKRIRARKLTDENGIKYYQISGPLFLVQ
jgi:SulP family sulfate permease